MLKYFINLGKVNPKALNSIKFALNYSKSFARREISKGHVIDQNIIIQKNIPSQKEMQSDISHFKINLTSLEDSLSFITKNIIQDNNKHSKFVNGIVSFLKSEGLLKNKKFINSLQEIALNYSQNNDSFQKSTLFKFICLIDQIFNKRALEFYEKENITHLVFPHLIENFNQNFLTLFSKDSDFLLNYNFLYFMSINRGEFSSCLQILFEHVKIKEEHVHQINKLLNTKVLLGNNSDSLESILNNKTFFKNVEENVTTPSSDLIGDYLFKFNEKSTKEKLLRDNIKEKKVYEKMKWVYNTLKGLQNFNIQTDQSFLRSLELFLSTNFIENSQTVFQNNYIKLKDSLKNQNKYLEAKLAGLSKLKHNNLTVRVSYDNLYDVYNPLFSGEIKLEVQFNKVAAKFDNVFALDLLRKYVEAKSESQSDYSFNDLYKLNTILVPLKFSSFESLLASVSFTHYDYETFNKIELYLHPKKVDGKLPRESNSTSTSSSTSTSTSTSIPKAEKMTVHISTKTDSIVQEKTEIKKPAAKKMTDGIKVEKKPISKVDVKPKTEESPKVQVNKEATPTARAAVTETKTSSKDDTYSEKNKVNKIVEKVISKKLDSNELKVEVKHEGKSIIEPKLEAKIEKPTKKVVEPVKETKETHVETKIEKPIEKVVEPVKEIKLEEPKNTSIEAKVDKVVEPVKEIKLEDTKNTPIEAKFEKPIKKVVEPVKEIKLEELKKKILEAKIEKVVEPVKKTLVETKIEKPIEKVVEPVKEIKLEDPKNTPIEAKVDKVVEPVKEIKLVETKKTPIEAKVEKPIKKVVEPVKEIKLEEPKKTIVEDRAEKNVEHNTETKFEKIIQTNVLDVLVENPIEKVETKTEEIFKTISEAKVETPIGNIFEHKIVELKKEEILDIKVETKVENEKTIDNKLDTASIEPQTEKSEELKLKEDVEENNFKPLKGQRSHYQNFTKNKISVPVFYKNTKKGFSEQPTTDETLSKEAEKKKKINFMVPPKTEEVRTIIKSSQVTLEAKQVKPLKEEPKEIKKHMFVIPEKTENKPVKLKTENITVITPVKKIEVSENLPKFIIPPKIVAENKPIDTPTKPEIKKVVVPSYSSKISSSTSNTKEAVKYEQAFQPIDMKKRILNLKSTDAPKSEGVRIIEKLDELSKSLQDLNQNLYFTYADTNSEGLDIERARLRYDINYWIKKIYNEDYDEEMDAREMEKHYIERLSKVFRKYSNDRDKTLMVIYSLTNPLVKSEFMLDLEYCFYQIFSNVDTNYLFAKTNLGHIGYQTLLNCCILDSSINNRNNFEAIINHIEATHYVPINDNIRTIIEICNRNYYPKYLKIIIDNFVINKNIKLSNENYTKYLQIMSNFEEMRSYVSNLIQNSFIDFHIQIKAEFYEQLLLNNLYESRLKRIESNLSYLNDRYLIDYTDVTTRNKENYTGNKFLLNLFLEFLENSKKSKNAEIIENKKEVVNIAANIIKSSHELNLKWKDDTELLKTSLKIYIENIDEHINNYIYTLTILIQQQKIEKTEFLEFVKKLSNLGARHTQESKIKIVNIFNQFIEGYLKNEIFVLNYEEKFSIIREENLFKFFKFFTSSKIEGAIDSHSNLNILKAFLELIVDPLTFDRLPKKDKTSLENYIYKLTPGARREALDFLDRIDVKKYI